MTPAARELTTVDFDLHGFARIRVESATVRDVAVVRRQLGLPPSSPEGEADVVVRFADRVAPGPLTYVGLQDCGFDDESFVVLRGNGGQPTRMVLPFESLSGVPMLECQRGTTSVPHLLAVLNLVLLGKDVLPLHASAFNVDGRGVLVTGWSKGGKTEALLAAATRGAHYVGDEWVFLTPDGTMWGLPERIRLWGWHLDQLPEVRSARSRGERRRVRAWRSFATAAQVASTANTPASGLARKAAPVLERQAYVQVPPAGLVGEAKVDLSGSLDAVVLVLSSTGEAITTTPATAAQVGRRMLASLREERAPLLAHYRQFRFAFPDRRCAALEGAPRQEARLLARLMGRRPAAVVTHPYPCDIAALGDAVLTAAADLVSGGSAVSREPV
ncbi:hypothetical protein [Nocardioides caldifontis]|uniref:hypothetical protein n=1 Tax=Nocardioides caldifontis TaxID=2588938 RepID=UPI0011DF6DEF|nr:hypothetical protein [Nocardioides caldifontis]